LDVGLDVDIQDVLSTAWELAEVQVTRLVYDEPEPFVVVQAKSDFRGKRSSETMA